jgi:plasmid maintenance system antidote protein VapI
MSKKDPTSPITNILKNAIVDSGIRYKSLSRKTGVARASIQRFVDGRQSIRLDVADRLAEYFGLGLVEHENRSAKKSVKV